MSQGVYPAEDTCAIGEEISSTGEGRHVTLYGDNLSHGTNVSYVTKGYPVWFGASGVGVGMPFETQTAALGNPLMAIDTEGIWCVDVYAHNDVGDVAVAPGEKLYVNTTTGIVSKINNVNTQLPFGYALGNVTSSETNRIAVKVHFDPNGWTDRAMYASLTGATTDNGFSVTVVDAIPGAGVYGRGLYISYDNNGVKTGGGAESNGLGIDMDADADTQSLYGVNVYTAALTGATINRVAAYCCYISDPPATVNAVSCIHLETAATTSTTNDFISMRSHALQDGILTFRSGGGVATHFLVFDPAIVEPCVAFSAAGNGDYSIKCYINGETTYLHTYDSA